MRRLERLDPAAVAPDRRAVLAGQGVPADAEPAHILMAGDLMQLAALMALSAMCALSIAL